MKMAVKMLRDRLADVDDDMPVTFQGNVDSGEEGSDEPSYTFCTGYVYNAFVNTSAGKDTFILDVAVTESQM